jgi:hypothetical protein
MDKFLQLPTDRRRRLCEEAQSVLALPAESIEKDFWVCWTLRELLNLPDIGSQLTFKGGTSLSKCWKLIERFSEDIDLVVDREALGFGGDNAPQQPGISGKERERRLEALKMASHSYVRSVLKPGLEKVLTGNLAAGLPWTLSEEVSSDGGITLVFTYPSDFPPSPGLVPKVKIEPGARSDTDPTEMPEIRSYLEEALPKVVPASPFTVRTVAPQRTFWEKAMLLHEETFRDSSSGPKPGLSRHYYDLHYLIKAGIATKAAADLELFERIAAHRAVFFRKKKDAQQSLQPGSLRLVPSESALGSWQQDYEKMRDTYFFGEPPTFDEIIGVVGAFEKQFNQQGTPSA